jgi:uncharacterized damage-inducible protein DinB
MDPAYLLARWEGVRAGLLATIEKLGDDDLSFTPYPGAWSVQRLLLHIAQEEHGEFGYGIAQTLSAFPPDNPSEQYPTVAAITALLATVHTETIRYLRMLSADDLERVITTPWGAQANLVELFDHIIEHEIHHRGELSLILGMLGREGLDA